ncbi:Dienelactone hydrolase family [Cedecea neteri]|uniref:Dienelactone hydrolase family n=1 Tax=Cedecea neteri TaxID=158822 RepID=A0A2X2V5N5_9ENTR|nr:Dienelactone hydrolase family [Cedecea neteri]
MSEIISTPITYQVENQTFEGALVYQENQSAARPGVLIAPNWMGVSAGAVEQAKGIAAQGYVVLVADLYGQGKRPTNADEAGALMMGVKDTPAEVGRMQAALDTLATQKTAAVDGSKTGRRRLLVSAGTVRLSWQEAARILKRRFLSTARWIP